MPTWKQELRTRAARGQRRERVTDWPLMGQHRGEGSSCVNDRMESLTELQIDFADQ